MADASPFLDPDNSDMCFNTILANPDMTSPEDGAESLFCCFSAGGVIDNESTFVTNGATTRPKLDRPFPPTA